MKRFQQFFVAGLIVCSCATAQTRYLDEVFTGVTVTKDVVYGNNLWCTMLGDCSPTSLTAKDIKMDIYEPAGDSLTERPLIIIAHTGNFLQRVLNGSPTGYKDDSIVIEMCNRFARQGYVAVAMSYRLGWNPTSPLQEIRTGTIINAAYRGVQDAHTCIRFFKKDVTLSGNTYGVDTSRIVLGGIGTGSYVSLAFATFDRWEEIYLNKFIDFSDPLNPEPYIDTSESGDFQGLLARPLNTPSNLGYSSKVNMVFNLGGAMGDSSWMEEGDVPIVSFHTTKDPNAPYGYGVVIVPTTGNVVLDASGSSDVIRRSNYLCNNRIFRMPPAFTDALTNRANALNSTGNLSNEAGVVNPNSGDEGLYPFITPPPGNATCTDPKPPGNVFTENEQGSPWDWWDETWYSDIAGVLGKDGPFEVCKARLSNPDMSPAKGRAYMDTVQGYLSPRIYRVLFESVTDTGCTVPAWASLRDAPSVVELEMEIYPNPASTGVTIKVDQAHPIKLIELHDVTGRSVRGVGNLSTVSYVLDRKDLSPGLYFVTVGFEGEVMTRMLCFE